MTDEIETPPATEPPATETGARKPRPARTAPPLLAELAQWYPRLFGERPLPLKRGIFQDLMAARAPDKDALKQALAWHTRSTRYLVAVAGGSRVMTWTATASKPWRPSTSTRRCARCFAVASGAARKTLRRSCASASRAPARPAA